MSKRFYILGEVQRTGEYPLVKHLTVLQAFALAGGFTEWASKKEIILLRTEDGKEEICIGSIEELKSEMQKAVAAGVLAKDIFDDFVVGAHGPAPGS